MACAWPTVRAALLALLPTLDGWEDVDIIDGPPVSADTGQQADGAWAYCAVGYAEDERGAGSWRHTPDGSGFFDNEDGEVRSELYTGNGEDELTPAITAGFTLVDSLKAYIAANRTLGGALPAGSTCSLSADVITGKSEGAGQLLVLTVSYTAFPA